MLSPRSCRFFLRLCEQWIELSGFVERIEIIAAAHMGFADENLRKGAAAVCALDHLLPYVPIPAGIDLMKDHSLPGEQFFRLLAIGTVSDSINFDCGHDVSKFDRISYFFLYGGPHRIGNPGEDQHIDVGRAGAAECPGAA